MNKAIKQTITLVVLAFLIGFSIFYYYNPSENTEIVDEYSYLTSEEISAIVYLECYDDNFERNELVYVGSGVIVDPTGMILTNRHIVENVDGSIMERSLPCYVGITENISDYPIIKYEADILVYSTEPDFDIALLSIEKVCSECEGAPASLPIEFPFFELADPSDFEPGDFIAIAGYPEIGMYTFTYTEGIMSGRIGDYIMKTDAKIDSGNSGGAALDMANQLIGVPTWVATGDAESIGYIIEADDVYDWINEAASLLD